MIEICGWCKNEVKILKKEWNRQKKNGREIFFCNLSCSAHYINSKREDLIKKIKEICPVCENKFETCTGKNKRIFCSRSCASKGSVTDKRRKKAREIGLKNKNKINLIPCEETLRLREGWKYELIEKILKSKKVKYQFEYRINDYIYDLAIFKTKLLFEFDGAYHTGKKQLERDEIKDCIAKENGWNIIRIKTGDNEVIKPYFLYKYIN